MANSDMQEALSPLSYHLTQIRPLEGHETQCLGSPRSINMRDEVVQKRCVPTPRPMRVKPMAIGTWRTNFSTAIAVGTRHLGDNLGTEVIHSYQQKTTKIQWTRIRPMAAGTQETNSGSRAKANHYIRGARRRDKSLKNASTQQTNSCLMAVLQRMIKSRVVAEHQMTTCLQATSTERIDHDLMSMLQ